MEYLYDVQQFKGHPFRFAYFLDKNIDYGASHGTHMDENEVRDAFWGVGTGDIILDVGCAFGSWLLAGMAAGAAYAYGWDPHQVGLDVLRKSLELNNWQDKVTLSTMGLYDRSGWIDNSIDAAPKFYAAQPEELAAETLHMNVQYAFPVVRLDDIVCDWPEGTYWMKLDVEASELEVLQGGVRFIEKFKPNIVVENHDFKSVGITERVRDFLIGLGYRHIDTQLYKPSQVTHSLYKP